MKFERICKYQFYLTESERNTLENTREILQKLGAEINRNNATFIGFTLKDIVNADETLDQIIDEGWVWDD